MHSVATRMSSQTVGAAGGRCRWSGSMHDRVRAWAEPVSGEWSHDRCVVVIACAGAGSGPSDRAAHTWAAFARCVCGVPHGCAGLARGRGDDWPAGAARRRPPRPEVLMPADPVAGLAGRPTAGGTKTGGRSGCADLYRPDRLPDDCVGGNRLIGLRHAAGVAPVGADRAGPPGEGGVQMSCRNTL